MKPLKGARPVPGPTIITGVCGLFGRRNCDLLTYTGTLYSLPSSGIIGLAGGGELYGTAQDW